MIDFFNDLMLPEMQFMRYSLLIAILASPALGIIGTMVVTRRISSIAGAISHAALGGIGIALFLQRVMLWSLFTAMGGAVAGALIAALFIGIVSLYAQEREDTIIGVMWAMGMSVGLLFLNWTPGYVDWQGYLFGNILLLSKEEIYLTIGLDIILLVPTFLFYNSILGMSFDSTFAILRGVKVTTIYLLLLALIALTIVLMMNIAGIILVIALLTLPAATATCLTKHLWSMMLLSSILSCFFVISGLILSYFFQMPSGPSIVVFSGIIYCLVIFIKRSHPLSKRGS